MYRVRWSIIFPLIVMFAIGALCECEYDDRSKINGICTVYINCDVTANIKPWLKNDWSCIRHSQTQQQYNRYNGYYYENIVTYDADYNIFITIDNIIEPFEIDLEEDQKRKIKSLNLSRGELTYVPPSINYYNQLEELTITGNIISELNLQSYIEHTHLNTVNFSNNKIENLLLHSTDGHKMPKIKTIDLSHNLINNIPKAYFAKFVDLHFLDLSYNLISNLEVLTFEGLVELEILNLQHNKIIDLGASLLRFQHMEVLRLDNNNLNSLSKNIFAGLTNLKRLNVSHNSIETIEIQSFSDMLSIKDLDLSYNRIECVKKGFFESNKLIQNLSLAFNQIKEIEEYSFNNLNFTSFDIQGNLLNGPLRANVFQGLSNIENLDINHQQLTSIDDNAFYDANNLKQLNLSNNQIIDLSQKCFLPLRSLEKLDLSNNKISHINFNNNNLTKLLWLTLSNNNLQSIEEGVFGNLVSLEYLNLAYNKITRIEPECFVPLLKLKYIYLDNNNFQGNLSKNSMKGLQLITKIDFSGSFIDTIANNSFSKMISLQYLNISNGILRLIEYEAFAETGSIMILDLSYNALTNFCMNTLYLARLKELYLNKNKLTNLTMATFDKLESLQTLNVSSNNLLHIETSSLQSLNKLQYFDISFNPKVSFDGILFNNLTSLSEVTLSYIDSYFTFRFSTNTSVSKLELVSNKIKDLETMCFFNLNKLAVLILSRNEVIKIDKKSFQTLPKLINLDLSKNIISDIEPGSFENTNVIENMNLSSNDIAQIKFGVFDSLIHLSKLDLSGNKIHKISGYLFHNTPNLSVLLLDNNEMDNIDIKSFNMTSVKRLSVGGNELSCHMLIDLYNDPLSEKIQLGTEHTDFSRENVRGISCKDPNVNYRLFNASKFPTENDNGDAIKNNTLYIPLMMNVLNDFQKALNDINLKKMVELLDIYVKREDVANENQARLIEFLKTQNIISLQSSANITNQLKEIANIVNDFAAKEINEKNRSSTTDLEPNSTKMHDEYFLKMITNYLEDTKKSINNEVERRISGLKPENTKIADPLSTEPIKNNYTSESFYVVCICLVIVVNLIMFVTLIWFIYRTKISDSVKMNNKGFIDNFEMN